MPWHPEIERAYRGDPRAEIERAYRGDPRASNFAK